MTHMTRNGVWQRCFDATGVIIDVSVASDLDMMLIQHKRRLSLRSLLKQMHPNMGRIVNETGLPILVGIVVWTVPRTSLTASVAIAD